MSYWTDRQDQLKKAAERDEKKLRKRLEAFYAAEFRRLDREIAAYYKNYGENEVLQYRTLLQALPDADRSLLMERMDDFAKKYPQYAGLMPIRESIYRLDRLQGLQYSVLMTEAEISGYTDEQVTKHLTKLSQQGLNYAMETLGFGKNFYSIDSDIVKQFVGKPWCNGENFSTRIWNDTQKLAQYLSQDVAQGFARGDSYARLVQSLRNRFMRVNQRDAYRLIYTEGTYVMAESSMQPFTEDFSQYRISTAGDSRVCPICRGISEQIFEISERQAGINFPPFHPWCRCTFEIVVDDWEKWMDDYVSQHSGDRKDAGKIERRLNSGGAGDILKVSSLPRSEEAVIPRAKFTEYTLNPERDADKAAAFKAALGYTSENVEELIWQIYEKLPEYEAVEKGDRGWGMTYEVIMDITGPNGKTAKVLTAWIDDKSNGEMRLTTIHVD